MDRPDHAGQRTVFLLRWSRARLSRSANPTAPPLRGPRTLVPAGDHRLLDPCHGRAALLVREQGGRPGLIATLEKDVIAWLEANVPQTPEREQRLRDDARAHWFTVVFDREGYSPELFQRLWQKRMAVLTYHKFPKEAWREEEFQSYQIRLPGGEVVTLRLGERGTDWRQSFFPVVLPHSEMLPKVSLKNVTERLLMFCI